jgi:hypothetical protein
MRSSHLTGPGSYHLSSLYCVPTITCMCLRVSLLQRVWVEAGVEVDLLHRPKLKPSPSQWEA